MEPESNPKPVLAVDHATWAGQSLADLERIFEQLGLPPQYGGLHSNGITEMSQVCFDDGSYLELISTAEPEAASPWWDEAIRSNGGPCAWAVWVQDIRREAGWAFDRGLDVRGPARHSRTRPDGVQLEWDLATVGRGEPGAVLPFLISDITPRSLRLSPSPGIAGTELSGIERVILGVRSLVNAAADFKRWTGWGSIQLAVDGVLGARLAHFPGQPFVLAEPLAEDGWLARRLDAFGESPCGLLLGSNDLDESLIRLPLGVEQMWLGRRLAWFDQALTAGHLLGVVERPEEGW